MTKRERPERQEHPGRILQKKFLEPLSLSPSALAREIRVPPGRIAQLVAGKRAMTADTALRLERYLDNYDAEEREFTFGGDIAEYFLATQTFYDLYVAENALKKDKDFLAIRPRAKKSVR